MILILTNTQYFTCVYCRYNTEILRQFSIKEDNSFDNEAQCLLCVGNENVRFALSSQHLEVNYSLSWIVMNFTDGGILQHISSLLGEK